MIEFFCDFELKFLYCNFYSFLWPEGGGRPSATPTPHLCTPVLEYMLFDTYNKICLLKNPKYYLKKKEILIKKIVVVQISNETAFQGIFHIIHHVMFNRFSKSNRCCLILWNLNFRICYYFKLNSWHGFSIRPMKYSTTAYIYYMAWKLTLVLPLRINLHLTFRQLAGYRTCLRKISLPDAGLIPSISILWPYFAIILKLFFTDHSFDASILDTKRQKLIFNFFYL